MVFLGDTSSEWMRTVLGWVFLFVVCVCSRKCCVGLEVARIALRMVLVGFAKLSCGRLVVIEVGMFSIVSVCLMWCGSFCGVVRFLVSCMESATSSDDA